ncbi:hypothetical protein F4604DRAFT_1927207 [Suillus subluteus]|nr:hypothetical protein F4604DRAFT_1927207 [Suillus subluteus]
MPLTTIMTLPVMYSKLNTSSGSKGWLPTSPSNSSALIPPAKCIQQQLQKPAEPTITLLTERQFPDKQVLADLKAVIQAKLDLTDDNQANLSLEHCAVILEALQNPQSNTIVIVGITPAEFAYFEDTQELQIMPLLPVHEQPATHISKAINKYTDALPYDKLLIDITMHLNHRIQNKDTTNIPDLHLAVTIQPPEDDSADNIEIPKPISKWVGESGLSSDYNFMVWKLSGTCDGHRDINSTLIMSFKEQTRWQQPKETSITAQTLCTSPTLEYEEFIPAHIKKSLKFGPVIIHSHVWIDISKSPDTFAEGTLYPTVQMSDVECMLRDSTNTLKGYIVSLMEGMNLEVSAIQLVCESNPMFEPIWGAAVNQISSAIYLTAYCHYLDWRHHKYSKRKISHETAQSLSTGDRTTASISSDPSTSSSDLTVFSSTAHPKLPLAKKAKTQSAEEPKLKSKLKADKDEWKGEGEVRALSWSDIHHRSIQHATSASVKDGEAPPSPQIYSHEVQTLRDVRLAEKTLADCILKENAALGKLYKFEATEGERKLEDADIDIGFVRHSVQKSGITLYEDSKP